ncbi:LPS export ABC transporter ATP-binding protein [Fontimonas sp. SYSU GA230001]|uniref:LPS export ABC transporter ATP-binding protein n=1 Tax=Fontimonas sp. SYSU GA230001 TaxID=3142450 RepID=UPI0032B3CE19
MSRPTLRAEHLVKRYKKRTVVRDVSVNVEAGEIVGLLGPNGAGKTTSFYMIVGLVAADSGRIELNGRDITALPMHARARLGIGYLPQEASVFRTLSVADNILAILELRGDLKAADRKHELDRLLGELHIGHIRDAEGQALSGGERRRVEIARALAANPHFILLDEPFAGVDPIAVGDIQSIVHQLSERGIGVLITDHNVRETLGICKRAYILAEGTVIAEGEPEALLQNETVRRVYLGESFRL